MSRITLDIPDDALAALNLPANEASDAVRLAAAAKLYEMGRLSTGAAARLKWNGQCRIRPTRILPKRRTVLCRPRSPLRRPWPRLP